ncbi:MAG: cytochrome c oxidase subunit 3, partial [Campylobacteraceae bacterium]|nr:cytochrome c oxidase subunit 3 [Campylobacteraceae bacterium]
RCPVFSSYGRSTINLVITLILGSFFVAVQFYEYSESLFSFNVSFYCSVFFLLTGFHGFHVIIGLFFLFICLIFDWFFIINKEAINVFHTKIVQLVFLRGMVLFICSEVMFFFSIF